MDEPTLANRTLVANLAERLLNAAPLRWLAGINRPQAVAGGGVAELSSSHGETDAPRSQSRCTVIIPVYNAFAEATACLQSVLMHTDASASVLVVDDCSSEGVFTDSLPQELLADERLTIVRNEQNLGFVKSCNWAMQQTAPNDVVLLNSDTEVTARWLTKMQQAAASRPNVGTVTPLTNNGTVCSIPEFMADNNLPSGYDLQGYAALVESVSAREYPELPTCVGFCVYIRREALERVGVFDAEAFGRGYGEENDLSCRLQRAGYVDVLDDATFVYHHGSMSFRDDTSKLIAAHLKVLAKRHRGFSARVQRYVRSNPLRAVHARIADAMFRRWTDAAEYTVLHILHKQPLVNPKTPLPGGIEYHVADLIRSIPEAAHWSIYAGAGEYHLTAHVPGKERRYRVAARAMELSSLVSRELFDVVHVHHASTFDNAELTDRLLKHGRYCVSIHDFSLCCPTINLLKPEGRVCNGHECAAACRQRPAAVQRLRAASDRLLQHAASVVHFSDSTRAELGKMFDGPYRWKRIEHGIAMPRAASNGNGVESVATPSHDVPLKVAFLGGIGPNKGADLVRKVVRHSRLPSGVPIEWHLVGHIDGDLDRVVHQHGRYERTELLAMVNRISPHVVAILSTWPETYCYTFDEALSCGIPIISTPLGAPAERLQRHRCGWMVKSLTPDGVLAALQEAVDDWDAYCEIRRRIPTLALRRADETAREYHSLYRDVCQTPARCRVEQFLVFEQQLGAAARRYRFSLQRMLGRSVNGGLAVLELVGLRRLAAGLARRVISTPTRRKLADLRHVSFGD